MARGIEIKIRGVEIDPETGKFKERKREQWKMAERPRMTKYHYRVFEQSERGWYSRPATKEDEKRRNEICDMMDWKRVYR